MSELNDAIARLRDHVDYGPASVMRIPGVARERRAGRVLLVCGQRSFEASGAAALLPDLESVATVHRWSDFAPNTDSQDLSKGLDIVREVSPDLVLGIGGGSAMDMAKLLCAYGPVDAEVSLPDRIRSGDRIESRDTALVLVPTTSGSGSEATHFAVVYIGEEKFSIAGPAMLPDRVILDPDLSRSGSPYQRATSGIDAICQAIESLWATGATPESRADAERGLALGLDHLETFVADATPAAAQGMCLASHYAGRAINISKTTAAHALSYGITKRHGVSHGHAVAVTLGPFLELHARSAPADLQPGLAAEQHAEAMATVLRALGAEDGRQARERFTDLLGRVGLEDRLTELGITESGERGLLAGSVNLERLGNNPVRFGASGLEEVLAMAG